MGALVTWRSNYVLTYIRSFLVLGGNSLGFPQKKSVSVLPHWKSCQRSTSLVKRCRTNNGLFIDPPSCVMAGHVDCLGNLQDQWTTTDSSTTILWRFVINNIISTSTADCVKHTYKADRYINLQKKAILCFMKLPYIYCFSALPYNCLDMYGPSREYPNLR